MIPELDQHVLQLKLRNLHLLYSNVQQLKLWNTGSLPMIPELDQHVLQLKLRNRLPSMTTTQAVGPTEPGGTSIRILSGVLQLKLWNNLIELLVLQLKLWNR
jgi:hypothetical protein